MDAFGVSFSAIISYSIGILELHFRDVPLNPSVSLSRLAVLTEGFSGACLAALCNESALLAARRGLVVVGPEEVTEVLRDMRRAGRGRRASPNTPAAAAAAAAAQHLLFQRREQTVPSRGRKSRIQCPRVQTTNHKP